MLENLFVIGSMILAMVLINPFLDANEVKKEKNLTKLEQTCGDDSANVEEQETKEEEASEFTD